jgi:hypothetical protein
MSLSTKKQDGDIKMNNVSLLLYAMDVVQNIAILCAIFLIFVGIGGCIATIACRVESGRFHPLSIVWAIAMVVVSLTMVLIPTRTTMLAIASSEFVEDFSKTEAGTEIGDLAQDTIKLLRKKLGELNEEE